MNLCTVAEQSHFMTALTNLNWLLNNENTIFIQSLKIFVTSAQMTTKINITKIRYSIFTGCCIAGASKFLGLEIPIRVQCWFCPHKQTVKFSQRNSWDCQSCSQYNGFNKDGDYNKEINGQHSEIPVYPKVIIT